ncbi:hypothetical protein [Pseudomonas putida]|uniref:hypothetical protein n=1 Tax=Pseudomonas putida TaxID=303 RepID=UPI002022D6AE|nr:hypothetical protein [Pseudomonas putida]MCL8307654.1 hypothetical protein [Pseudomonas putida]
MWVWRETREKWLGISALLALILIALINLKLPVWPILNGSGLDPFLRADATGSVLSDLLVGLFSAYVFYLLIELVPKQRAAKHTLETLNLLVASVVDAYEVPTMCGHEKPITSVNLSVLTIEKVRAHKSHVVKNPDMIRLTSAMRTGHSRYQDVQHALGMAVSISPEHARDWLVLTDKLRLLADEYEAFPQGPFIANAMGEPTEEQRLDHQAMAAHNRYLEAMKFVPSSLQMRVMEVFEATVFWLERQAS